MKLIGVYGMHDGSFPKKGLSRIERRLMEQLINPDHYSDTDRADTVVALVAAVCRLPNQMLPDQCPDDLLLKEWLRERLQDELLNPFARIVWQFLESNWDTQSYAAVLRDAVANALDDWLDTKGRWLECKIFPGEERDAAEAMRYLQNARVFIDKYRKEVLVAEFLEAGCIRVPPNRKPLDIDGPIVGVNLSELKSCEEIRVQVGHGK